MNDGSLIGKCLVRTAALLRRVFRERQIYVRSEGDIRFIVLSPKTQVVACLATVILLGWFAYATVNVTFKDQIIALKEQRIAEVKHAYETRISEIRSSVDQINSRLLLNQDTYLEKVDDLRVDYEKLIDRQKTLEAFFQQGLMENTGVEVDDDTVDAALPTGTEEADTPEAETSVPATLTGNGDSSAPVVDPAALGQGAPVAPAMPGQASPAEAPADPQDARPEGKSVAQRHGSITPRIKPGLDERGAVVATLTDLSMPEIGPMRDRYPAPFTSRDKVLSPLEDVGMLARHLDHRQHGLLSQADERRSAQLVALKKTTKTLGLSPDKLIAGAPAPAAVGGPYVPVAKDADNDPLLVRISRSEAARDDMEMLRGQLRKLPLAMPMQQARQTSGFGTRRDPFRRSRAQHTGIDLKAWHGAPVKATAGGVVVEAQWSSGYGKLVVIDHDNGVSTRYAHLSVISVTPGQRVSKGAVVGRLGNTGRSTGAHLHYETRVSGRAVDPKRFWQARNDLQEQEQARTRP